MSVKRNFIYSSILTTANYIFPLITYPYISRVLGVENIGLCNFVDSIINYFILFSMLGMSIVGIREIASVKDDKPELIRTFSSLFFISGFMTVVSVLLLLLCIFFIPELYQYKKLLFIGVIKLIGNFFLIEWFYKGLEDFKYITRITIFVKVLYVIAIFVFVREKNDYSMYFLLTSLMVAVNALFNCLYAKKFVNHLHFHIEIKKYVKPLLILGGQLFLTSMYTSINVAFLGFVSSTVQVGYYTTATRLFAIIISLYFAYTGVLLPRMSNLVSIGDNEGIIKLINKSFDILFACSIPVIILSIILSQEIVLLVSGPGYEGAIIPSCIVFPLVFVIGFNQIMMIQVLMPFKKDRALFICSVVGALAGIMFNLILVPSLESIGSAMVWLFSELFVAIVAQHYVTKAVNLKFPITLFLKNIISYVPLVFFLLILKYVIISNYILLILISGILLVLYIGFVQTIILKNETIKGQFNQILCKYGHFIN